MPVAATVSPVGPYKNAEAVLQIARVMVDDAGSSFGINGNLLSDSQPGVFVNLQSCYDDLQKRLITGGVETLSKYGYCCNLPATTSQNSSNQQLLTYTGFFDGNIWYGAPFLPPDLIQPLELWERQSSGNPISVSQSPIALVEVLSSGPPLPLVQVTYNAASGQQIGNLVSFAGVKAALWLNGVSTQVQSSTANGTVITFYCAQAPSSYASAPDIGFGGITVITPAGQSQSGPYWKMMDPVADSISTRPVQQYRQVWDYQNDTIILPQSGAPMDLKIKYLIMDQPITGPDSVVMLLGCESALAAKLGARFCKSRGGIEAASSLEAEYESYCKQRINTTVRRRNYVSCRPRGFRQRARRFGWGGWNGQGGS
jgi:hypothetical protein